MYAPSGHRSILVRINLRGCAVYAAALTLLAVSAAPLCAAPKDLLINEYNSVSGSDYLGGVNANKVDSVFGRLQGNGQNWLEFVVVQDHLDLRGYKVDWFYDQNFLGQKTGTGEMIFSQDPLWSNVRQGTVITVTEWQEAWYADAGINTSGFQNYSREGGVNGLGHQRNNPFNAGPHQFVDLSTDLRWSPELGDWNMNVFAGERDLSTGAFKYFDFNGEVTEDGGVTTFEYGEHDNAGIFTANNDNWQVRIRDAGNNVVLDYVGEAVPGWAGGGINSGEVGKIEHDDVDAIGPPPTEASYRGVSNASFKDGSSSTYGTANVGTGYQQILSPLQVTAFNPADVKQRNSTANSTFSDGTKWAGGAAPSATQQATFEQGSVAPYTVSFDASTQTDTLVVRNDRVSFDLNGNTYTAASSAEFNPSIVVGQSTGQTAVVAVTDGTLAGSVANVAQKAGSNGSLTINSTGNLALSKSLFVGGADDRRGGTGSVVVETGGKLTVGRVAKVFSTGSLTLAGGTATIGTGAAETTANTLRIWSTGTLDLRGGSVSATAVALSGGTIGGYGSLSSAVSASGGTLNAVGYDDGLAGQLTLSGPLTTSAGSTLTKLGDGALTISGVQTHGVGAALNANAGTTNLNSDAGGNLALSAAATVNFGSSQHLASLTVSPGVTVNAVAGGNKVIVTGGLTLAGATNAWTGQLDLNDNALVVQSNAVDAATTLARVTNQIKTGHNGGAWDGAGINSTSAADDVAQLTAVGVLRNDNGLGGAIYNTFFGQSVDANSILATLTYYGDANLNGDIDSSDYSLIDNGFNFGLTGWLNGDFNYDGSVNATDYALIDNAFGLFGGPLAAEMISLHSDAFGQPYLDALANLQSVPEPSTLALLAMGAIGLVIRGRRRLSRVSALGRASTGAGMMAAVAVLVGAFCLPAEGALTVNLRLAGGATTRELVAADVGTDIPIQVWASVTATGGVNGTGADEGLQFLTYSLTSQRLVAGTNGSVSGDLLTPALVTPFEDNGSSAGDVADLNGDGIDDLGSLAAESSSSFAKPRSAAATYSTTSGITGQAISGGFEFLVETIQFHVDSLPAAPVAGNGTRFTAAIPSWSLGFVKGANWFQNSNQTPTNGANNGLYSAGTSVTFSVAVAPSFILGDMDGDGDRDNFDIDDFELALTNPTAYLVAHPTLTDYQDRGDIEGDDDFDNFDIQPFEQLLTGGPGGAPVPEPGSMALLAIGTLGLVASAISRRRRNI